MCSNVLISKLVCLSSDCSLNTFSCELIIPPCSIPSKRFVNVSRSSELKMSLVSDQSLKSSTYVKIVSSSLNQAISYIYVEAFRGRRPSS